VAKLITYLCNTWAGSDVDRGHHWEKMYFFKRTFQALQCTAASIMVACGWLDSGWEQDDINTEVA